MTTNGYTRSKDYSQEQPPDALYSPEYLKQMGEMALAYGDVQEMVDAADLTFDDGSLVDFTAQQTPAEQLAAIKTNIVKLARMEMYIQFELARQIRLIEEHKLFALETNPDTGKPYRSMREYFPYLMEELEAAAKLPKLSVRQMREYLALKKLFVDQLGISEQEIMETGVSHYTLAREAIDYNPDTGVPNNPPRPGKLAAETALEILQQAREGGWRVQDTKAALNEVRGTKDKRIGLRWERVADEETGELLFKLVGITIVEDGVVVADTSRMYLAEDDAAFITKRAGGMSNWTFGGDTD